LPPGRADAVCLRQAIWNVLENAEQATGDAGPIAVSAEISSAGGIRLTITDSGAGIADDMAERVFLPFVTTREKGTGLGLATARKIVEAHGGQIKIGNHASGGAAVCFELPGAPTTVS
jgi:signal transduction histidine kinase